ncbi:hypothetical protein LINPERPRIM_LOCUS33915 [Linum perenne]
MRLGQMNSSGCCSLKRSMRN